MRAGVIDWTFPYPSQRMPVLADHVVATSQPLAAQAGLAIMMRGGNAVDAAIATAAALMVTEPTSNGIGSDAFALVWSDGALHGLNASGRAPSLLTPAHLKGHAQMPVHGWPAVTVPGAVDGWKQCHDRFGALPFADLLEPAIRLAREGYPVAPQTAHAWARSAQTFRDEESWQQTFAPSGRTPAPGERVRLPDHAATLESIAADGGASFYRGALAERIEAFAVKTGGLLRASDLAAHESDWPQPIDVTYHGVTLHELPPNGQGLAALLMLGIVRSFDLASMKPGSALWLHLQIEAMKIAFAEAHRVIADPLWMREDVSVLLEPARLEALAGTIDDACAGDPGHTLPKPGGTVLLTTADRQGTMVAFIQSNYMGFGSGLVVPGTGIALQNRGACFSLEPGHPNEVLGGKRPYHTIIPAFVSRRDELNVVQPLMAFGVMGGFMQPQGHAQMVIRITDHHENPQAALDAPRWQVGPGRRVMLEPGFDGDAAETLRDLGHDVIVSDARTVAHGGGQAIYRLDEGYLGASDSRRDGQAVGF